MAINYANSSTQEPAYQKAGIKQEEARHGVRNLAARRREGKAGYRRQAASKVLAGNSTFGKTGGTMAVTGSVPKSATETGSKAY